MRDPWYALESDEVILKLQSSREGLSDDEARMRRDRSGPNVLPRQGSRSDAELIIDQIASPLLALLAIAWAISLLLHHWADAAFIGVFVLVNTLVGFYQERKASRSIEALRSLVTMFATTVRAGRRKVLDGAMLVSGDIIRLAAGDRVPADSRLLSAHDLRVDESALTGEWLAVPKAADAVNRGAPLAERASMVFMGTVIESGEAEAVVVAIGSSTEIGRLAETVRAMPVRKTPLQERIAHLAHVSAIIILGVIALIVAVGFMRGQEPGETFVVALALAVSAIPANLLPAVTLILSLGMLRSLRRRALVRRLAAGETLGSITAICTDKTGTLTEGTMEVDHVLVGGELLGETLGGESKEIEALRVRSLERASLGCDAFIENPDDDMHTWIVRGHATEAAVVLEAHRQGIEKHKLEREYPVQDRVSFSPRTKYSVTLRKRGVGAFVSVLGAPEIVMGLCNARASIGGATALTPSSRTRIAEEIERLAASGLRLVAVATKDYLRGSPATGIAGAPQRLTLLGLIALKDPLRIDARESVLSAERAGIRTVLITGDHPATALSVAHAVGIESRRETLMIGQDIDYLGDEELEERARDITIYARVSPEHKLRIVRALQRRQDVVAMVGDGVNDAPALRAADIGIAVGSGTDVAKEAADMVLLDNSFRSIVAAVEEGRLMFRNIRKVFAYLIGDDLSELSLFCGALVVGLPLPLLPAQILWINIVEDAMPVAGLAAESDRAGIMEERPRGRSEPIAHVPLRRWLVAIFWITGVAAFLAYLTFLHITSSVEEARSMTFALLSFDSLLFSLSVRSFQRPIWRSDIFSNRALSAAVAVGVLLTVCALYLPPLQQLLGTVAISVPELLLVGFISGIEIVLVEGYKKLYFAE